MKELNGRHLLHLRLFWILLRVKSEYDHCNRRLLNEYLSSVASSELSWATSDTGAVKYNVNMCPHSSVTSVPGPQPHNSKSVEEVFCHTWFILDTCAILFSHGTNMMKAKDWELTQCSVEKQAHRATQIYLLIYSVCVCVWYVCSCG